MSTYVAIGSVCWDEVEGEAERRLGGSVLFSGQVALAAGWDVRVITSGTAALATAAKALLDGVEVIVLPSRRDTVMTFGRSADLGPQSVPTVADPIDIDAVAAHLRGAEVVHLAPIMGEVTAELIALVAGESFVGMTPQGLMRTRDPHSHHLELLDAPGAWWAQGADAVVVSESEYARISEPLARDGLAVAVTRGADGCFGWCGDEQVDLPGVALAATSPTGTIGAGDVFAGALFLAMAEGHPFAQAMDAANRRAAAHVGGVS